MPRTRALAHAAGWDAAELPREPVRDRHLSLLLQSATVARTTQMMTNLLDHYGRTAEFDGVTLKAFCTPEDITGVDEATFRDRNQGALSEVNAMGGAGINLR